MAVSSNSVVGFSFTVPSKYQQVSRSHVGASMMKANTLGMFGFTGPLKGKRLTSCLAVTNSGEVATDKGDKDAGNAERSISDSQVSAVKLPPTSSSLQNNVTDETRAQTSEISNGSALSSEVKQDPSSTPGPQSKLKRTPLTAREKLRAARVLSRYNESKASKPALGSNVLQALKESDRGKKRSGLPEAPSNLFDDSKRGMPKPGWTFDFPGGFDLFLIIFSFVFISTVMLGTTYLVWKVGAIHFNEY
ncbi:hypothetical protein RJ641_035887 [Dillenia turbinata]|uniref:Uncharacterized protein n=1 Tax=Dillenia turbinata TaxID=194707 RepID=A0AAN8VDE9_9MAGN